jgi:RNA polymerase sigma-70 factor (ECF subfamily)
LIGELLEERDLVQKILQGDEQAKTQFYVQYRERLYKDCVFLLGYRDPEAEDVVQEAFMVAFKKLPEFEFRSTLSTWLTQICIYLCYNRYRARAKTVVHEQDELERLLGRRSVEGDGRKDQDEERAVKLQLIDRGLEKIGEECRQIVVLRDKEEKTYIEIGKIMKIPLGTVMSRLSRCKKALKVIVQQMMGEG